MPVEVICANPACGKAFAVLPCRSKTAKYCSVACRAATQSLNGTIECRCQTCGKAFTIFACKAKKGLGKYCSPACQHLGLEKRVTVTCLHPSCGKRFPVIEAVFRNKKGKFCSRACFAAWMEGETPLVERFWPLVQVCEHGQDCVFCCWPWQGRRNAQGYGRLAVKSGKRWTQKLAHRIAWELLNAQPMPAHLGACHHCDVPACCNGMHLYPGTQQHNMNDAKARGRMHPALGEASGKAKLHASDIPQIWAMRQQGVTIRLIAEEMSVSLGTIDAVLHFRTWGHISRTLPNAEQSLKLSLIENSPPGSRH